MDYLWNRVFVLGADMEKTPAGNYEFVEGDKNGYIGGEMRIHAAQTLLWKGLVKEMFVVAGPTKDGASKASMMAKLIGPGVVPLESVANTGGNFGVIAKYYRKDYGPALAALGIADTAFSIRNDTNDGILTNLYHLPRFWLLAQQNGLENFSPIPAEGVLAVFGHPNVGTDLLELLTKQCGNALYARRILSEARRYVEIQAKQWRASTA